MPGPSVRGVQLRWYEHGENVAMHHKELVDDAMWRAKQAIGDDLFRPQEPYSDRIVACAVQRLLPGQPDTPSSDPSGDINSNSNIYNAHYTVYRLRHRRRRCRGVGWDSQGHHLENMDRGCI